MPRREKLVKTVTPPCLVPGAARLRPTPIDYVPLVGAWVVVGMILDAEFRHIGHMTYPETSGTETCAGGLALIGPASLELDSGVSATARLARLV